MNILLRRVSQTIIFFILALVLVSRLYAVDNSVSPTVRALAERAFATRNQATVQKIFLDGIARLNHASQKIQAYQVLADYESLSGLYQGAAEHYKAAAFISDPRSEVARSSLIKAVRALLSAGDDLNAGNLIESLESSMTYPPQYMDYALHVYRLWLDFRIGRQPFARLKQFLADDHYQAFHPALLFSLWWFSHDQTAIATLQNRFPNSIENAVVQGRVELNPSLFWYVMPRNIRLQESFDSVGTTCQQQIDQQIPPKKSVAGKAETPRYHQVGFFESEVYAQRLTQVLQKKGFSVHLIKKTGQKGRPYFAVLVRHQKNTVIKLRDAGYESVPVF